MEELVKTVPKDTGKDEDMKAGVQCKQHIGAALIQFDSFASSTSTNHHERHSDVGIKTIAKSNLSCPSRPERTWSRFMTGLMSDWPTADVTRPGIPMRGIPPIAPKGENAGLPPIIRIPPPPPIPGNPRGDPIPPIPPSPSLAARSPIFPLLRFPGDEVVFGE